MTIIVLCLSLIVAAHALLCVISQCADCGMDVHKQCIVTAVDIKCTPNRKMIKKGAHYYLGTEEFAGVPGFIVKLNNTK